MEITVTAAVGQTTGVVAWLGRRLTCALGRSGLVADKREGDGGTPLAVMPLRRLFYRPDRGPVPVTGLPVTAIRRDFGWCDDPASPAYNRLVRLPCPWGHEVLWREDYLYDLIVELGYNDAPPVPGGGSAIFLHVARDGLAPTEGCVALAVDDLRALLADCRPGDVLHIRRKG